MSRSPKRKPEDKAQKEKRNQAAGQQIKEKASSVLKREKPLTSVRNAERASTSGSGRGSLPSSATPRSVQDLNFRSGILTTLESRIDVGFGINVQKNFISSPNLGVLDIFWNK